MISHSLADRTKAALEVPPQDFDGTLLSSSSSSGFPESSLEQLYTSQEGLAFDCPPDTDAFLYALSPEPIRDGEKEEPKPQVTTGAMTVRKTSSSSTSYSGDVAAPPPTQAKKKKYTRAFSHRARTGCMTCTRGGSPASSCRSSPSRRSSSTPLFTINPIVFESATEARYFHHFRVCTRFGLADSAGLLDYWDAYALPIAHQEDYLRQTISAVGAAHQLFVIRAYTSPSSSSSWDTGQENAAIQQYNRAISSLVKAMSSPNSVASTHGALLCCLMFVTFESLMGRYSESIKHIQSGFQLLASLDAGSKIRDAGLWQQTYDMFARLGLEFSAFMDAPLTPALPSNMPIAPMAAEEEQAFDDLNDAMYSLRTLDIGHFLALHEAEQQHLIHHPSRPPTPEGKMASLTVSDNHAVTATKVFGPLWEEHWNDRFYAWNRRFERTARALPPDPELSDRDRGMLARLRLQQSFWEMAVELSHHGGDPRGLAPATAEACLQRAERLAAPFLAAGKPTFSLDGDLISDLSFIFSVCRDGAQQARALELLRSLNRREGIWDSREIAEMHECSLRLGVAQAWGEDEELGCSVPAFMRSLARMSQRAYTPRAGLVSMADFRDTASNSSGAVSSSISDGEEIYVV
ncbi:hypothetical protein PG991_012051 [Apiospora marii]|uniref:Uncharacterized protein n=1 Tax=Apiospora marii TaxID=335849 RepID=A0ABR1RGA6_9PEZI